MKEDRFGTRGQSPRSNRAIQIHYDDIAAPHCGKQILQTGTRRVLSALLDDKDVAAWGRMVRTIPLTSFQNSDNCPVFCSNLRI